MEYEVISFFTSIAIMIFALIIGGLCILVAIMSSRKNGKISTMSAGSMACGFMLPVMLFLTMGDTIHVDAVNEAESLANNTTMVEIMGEPPNKTGIEEINNPSGLAGVLEWCANHTEKTCEFTIKDNKIDGMTIHGGP